MSSSFPENVLKQAQYDADVARRAGQRRNAFQRAQDAIRNRLSGGAPTNPSQRTPQQQVDFDMRENQRLTREHNKKINLKNSKPNFDNLGPKGLGSLFKLGAQTLGYGLSEALVKSAGTKRAGSMSLLGGDAPVYQTPFNKVKPDEVSRQSQTERLTGKPSQSKSQPKNQVMYGTLPPTVNTNFAAYDESVTLPDAARRSAGNAGSYIPPTRNTAAPVENPNNIPQSGTQMTIGDFESNIGVKVANRTSDDYKINPISRMEELSLDSNLDSLEALRQSEARRGIVNQGNDRGMRMRFLNTDNGLERITDEGYKVLMNQKAGSALDDNFLEQYKYDPAGNKDVQKWMGKTKAEINAAYDAMSPEEKKAQGMNMHKAFMADQDNPASKAKDKATAWQASNEDSSISKGVQPLQKLIFDGESYGGNYGAFNMGGKDGGHTAIGSGKDTNIPTMTVAEAMNSDRFAQGAYQIIPKTLKGLMDGAYGDTGVKMTDKFDKSTQDKFFTALARNRVVKGNIDETMKGLRNEWISLQNVEDSVLRPAVESFMTSLGR